MDDYCTLDEARAWCLRNNAGSDIDLAPLITAASRWIDHHCGQAFDTPSASAERTFLTMGSVPDSVTRTSTQLVGYRTVKFPAQSPAATVTAVEVDSVSVSSVNLYGPTFTDDSWRFDNEPVRGLLVDTAAEVVDVTGTWGWPVVPEPVTQACLMLVARLAKRQHSPEGVAGFGEFGVVRVTNRLDPDIAAMLQPYRWPTGGLVVA